MQGETKINYAGRVYNAQEIVNLVDASLDFWLTAGPYANRLERRLKEYFHAKDVLLVNSGSSANLVMMATLMSHQLDGQLLPGDEVITPAVTFPTTLAPILQAGCIPVFVDCELGTYNIDASQIESALSERTRAILIPHTLGNPCDMDVIATIARKHNLFLLEDVCDAFGSRFDGRLVGTFGDMASLSFYPAHHITMGEGGGVIVNKQEMRRVCKSIRDWGRDCWCESGQNDACGKRFEWQLGDLPMGYDHKYIYSNIGYNLKVTDMQAAVGLAQMDKIDRFIQARKMNFTRYYKGLQGLEDYIVLPRWHKKADSAWFGFPITVRENVDRLQLISWLEEAKIETRLVFGGNIIRQPAFLNVPHTVHGTLNESDRIMNNAFFIGVYPGLTEEMIDYVIKRIRDFFTGRGKEY